MTQIIDVEARDNPRYQQRTITFRRNDQDRRPSRPFARPNDYAPTWEQRQAESERRRLALEAKRMKVDADEPAELERKAQEKVRQASLAQKRVRRIRAAFLLALLDGPKACRDIHELGICSMTNSLKVGQSLHLAGFVSVSKAPHPTATHKQMRSIFSLTEAGREEIKAGQALQ